MSHESTMSSSKNIISFLIKVFKAMNKSKANNEEEKLKTHSDDHGENYQSRNRNQIKQYRDQDCLLPLPEIHNFYVEKHLYPRLRNVLGCANALDFYASNILKTIQKGGNHHRLLSVGAGDCRNEVKIAKRLVEQGAPAFVMECHDLSPTRLERGRRHVREEGLEPYFRFHQTDYNRVGLEKEYAVIIANHSLHHISNLEGLFASLHQNLMADGLLLTIDMIGRNGHMRWPESLELINMLWRIIPDRYKYNHQFRKFHPEFINGDCSTKGEGIRSQDILALLTEHFSCHAFYAFGNLPDVFIERGYGHNLDVANEKDTSFIDFLEGINDILLNIGYLKPTMMYGVFGRKEKRVVPRCYHHRTPEFCIRKTQTGDNGRGTVENSASVEKRQNSPGRSPAYLRDNIFAIVCHARTGSTMLVHLLRSHPDIWCHGEVFLHQGELGALNGTYRQKGIISEAVLEKLRKERRDNPEAFTYKYVFDPQGRKVSGFKFKMDEYVLPEFSQIRDLILKDTDIKIIFLTRTNKLQRYLSWYMANNITRVLLLKKREKRPAQDPIRLDPEECLKNFAMICEREKSIRGELRYHRVLEITYEDLVRDPDESHRALCRFLGVPWRPLETETRKILAKEMSKAIENYDELKSYFADTEYSPYFE